jgi:hypothetical protein
VATPAAAQDVHRNRPRGPALMVLGEDAARRIAWVVWLPLVVAPWLGVHCLAYALVPPGSHEYGHAHASGHAYLVYSAPILAACGLTLLLAGVILGVGEGLRARPRAHPPLRLFLLLPPLGFVVQEHLEPLIGTGAVPYDVVLEPTFLLGLALQLPFALAALLLTRALYAIGYGLGRAFARMLAVPCTAGSATCLLVRLPASATLVAPSVLALGHGQRAPPATACP